MEKCKLYVCKVVRSDGLYRYLLADKNAVVAVYVTLYPLLDEFFGSHPEPVAVVNQRTAGLTKQLYAHLETNFEKADDFMPTGKNALLGLIYPGRGVVPFYCPRCSSSFPNYTGSGVCKECDE